MQYRRFGRTNLQMPVFSCGGMRYQFQWQDVPMSQIPDENQGNLEAIINKSLEVQRFFVTIFLIRCFHLHIETTFFRA